MRPPATRPVAAPQPRDPRALMPLMPRRAPWTLRRGRMKRRWGANTQQWVQERKAHINWHVPISIYICALLVCILCTKDMLYALFLFELVANVSAPRVFLMGLGTTNCLTSSEGYCGVFVCVCEGSVWF
ncbi:hypothetical protein TcCL_ESM05926 [Trypanosoma cruzi]|nr:hypothetical protein TcCL_ESM05926 [Trypanosoma cruzi]